MNQTKLAEICFVASHLQALDPFLMNMIQVSWIQVSYAMSIVGVQKGYGKIRWLDMLGHRIFPRHFWFLLIFAEFLSYQLFRCPSVQVCPKSCPDTASALLHEARKIRLKQVVWPYYYTDSVAQHRCMIFYQSIQGPCFLDPPPCFFDRPSFFFDSPPCFLTPCVFNPLTVFFWPPTLFFFDPLSLFFLTTHLVFLILHLVSLTTHLAFSRRLLQ